MASKYETVNWGKVYCGGGVDFCEQGYYRLDNPKFVRKNASEAYIQIDYEARHWYKGVRWVAPGRPQYLSAVINGVEVGTSGQIVGIDDCSGSAWFMETIASGNSGTAFTQTSANSITSLSLDPIYNWVGASGNWNTFQFSDPTSGNNWAPLVYDINNNNYKILPPTGLTHTVSKTTETQVTTTANLASWSANPNITGTPYTGSGGANWNFQCNIKLNGTAVATISLNTGETKTATADFTGILLKTDTTYTIEWIARNNYQQQVVSTSTFKLLFIGYVVTQASTKKISYITITDPQEEGGNVHYDIRYARRIQ